MRQAAYSHSCGKHALWKQITQGKCFEPGAAKFSRCVLYPAHPRKGPKDLKPVQRVSKSRREGVVERLRTRWGEEATSINKASYKLWDVLLDRAFDHRTSKATDITATGAEVYPIRKINDTKRTSAQATRRLGGARLEPRHENTTYVI